MSRGTIYLLAFGILILVAASVVTLVVMQRKGKGKGNSSPERFTAETDNDKSKDGDTVVYTSKTSSSSYRARMSVMQTFTEVVGRKASKDEIEKYSSLGSDTAIREAIERDHVPSGVVSERFSEVPSKGSDGDGKSQNESDDDDDSTDDDDDKVRNDRKDEVDDDLTKSKSSSHKWRVKHAGVVEPEPYSHHSTHKDTAAAPDLGFAGKGSDRKHVCLDRRDVLKRLQAIADDVERFRQTVMMM